jgi:hypothetical protein
MAGTALPASAAVVASASEALLVPLTVWSRGGYNDPNDPTQGYTPAVDTLIELVIPASVGFDDVPNIYTARHTTPTNILPTALTPGDPDLNRNFISDDLSTSYVHWYWFNKRSKHLLNGKVKVSMNDVVQLSWTELAGGAFNNEPGYMVIANDSAKNGSEAVFSMFGNAWITGAIHVDDLFRTEGAEGIGFPLIGGSIPVLGMNDGADGPIVGSQCPQPTIFDSVKYKGGVPCGVSPLIAGFRTNRSDGAYDLFAFDVTLSNRIVPTIQVIWFDQNLNDRRAINAQYPGNLAVPNPLAQVEVYDVDENSCSTSINLPNELNVVWIPPAWEDPDRPLHPWNQPFAWTTKTDRLCVASGEDVGLGPLFSSGFVQYKMDEYIDTNVDRAESAAYAFSIKVDGGWVSDNPLEIDDTFVMMLESSLGHDLGTFKQY